MDWLQQAVDGLVCDDERAALEADAAAGTQAEKYGILGTSVGQELDYLVQEDGQRGRAHAMRHREHWADLKHGVPATQ